MREISLFLWAKQRFCPHKETTYIRCPAAVTVEECQRCGLVNARLHSALQPGHDYAVVGVDEWTWLRKSLKEAREAKDSLPPGYYVPPGRIGTDGGGDYC